MGCVERQSVFQQQMRLNDAMNLMAEDGIDADELRMVKVSSV
jgi:hypothetical protein